MEVATVNAAILAQLDRLPRERQEKVLEFTQMLVGRGLDGSPCQNDLLRFAGDYPPSGASADVGGD